MAVTTTDVLSTEGDGVRAGSAQVDASNIGRSLVARLKEELSEQVHNAIARHIHTKVRDARKDPDFSARRWPFELIQNAHDAGPRDGRDGIAIAFRFADGVLRVEHDAAPFSMGDIAALITGGSSKDFTSVVTTGRFGTGFLVTHVLSERVQVSGVLEVDEEQRAFSVELNRPDDEKLILLNIEESENALAETSIVDDLETEPTATFEYEVDDDETALTGLRMLEQALPHLFGTCRHLRRITIERDGAETCWTADDWAESSDDTGKWVGRTDVSLTDDEGESTDWRIVRLATSEDAQGWLVVALQSEDDGWSVCKPGEVPRLFRQLPLIGGPVLPMWAIIDGQFDVDQERRSIHVVDEAGQPLRDAFAAIGPLVSLASEEGWRNAYRLAQLALPKEGLTETAVKVWREILSSEATNLARLPIVNTAGGGLLPSVFSDDYETAADFIRRPLSGPTHAELWDLAATCTANAPPAKSDSEGWSEIAEGWEDLGVQVHWIDLESIGQRACSEVSEVSELSIDGDPYRWLSHYLVAVGKTWKAIGVTKHLLHNLVPDQHGALRSAGELRRDGGVNERIKEIASEVGLDFKAKLLSQKLVEALSPESLGKRLWSGSNVSGEAASTAARVSVPTFLEKARGKNRSPFALYAIREVTGNDLTEDEAVRELADHISDVLPDDQRLDEEDEDTVESSIALLEHLWSTQGEEAKEIVLGIPWLVADGTLRRVGPRRQMVLPVATWPETARLFANAYPANRVLADRYASAEDTLSEALVLWGVAHPGLLLKSKRDELRDRALKVIATNPDEMESATLKDAEWTQIALLEPEVLNHCRQSRELASALLGLVVCYVAPNDTSWRCTIETSVRTTQGVKRVHLTPSLWLSDLRSKQWVPVEEEDSITHHIPNPELMRSLIDPAWLEGNRDGANFLVEHFGLDALDVRILAAGRDEQARQRIRDSLARIVEVVGDNSQMIHDLAAKAEQRNRDVGRMRRLGLAVQECVRQALRQHGLEAERIDHGYDYLVTDVTVREEDPEDLSACFEVNEYKIEVKATTKGEACLTPLQAMTCATEEETFVLCVVDLRNFEGDVHQVDWETADISDRCKLISGEELPIDKTLTLVRSAEGGDVPIRNAGALRYAVPPELWESGLDIDGWVQEAFSRL